MAAPFGNKNSVGNKGGGRRPISEEMLKRALEWNYKELAKDLVTRHLVAMKADPESHQDEIKEIALPLVLKDMTAKVDTTSNGESINVGLDITKLTNLLNDVYRGTSIAGNGGTTSLVGNEIQNKE